MGDKSQTFKNLNPPPDIPPLPGGFQPQTTKNHPGLEPITVLEAIQSDLCENIDDTNPNVAKTPLPTGTSSHAQTQPSVPPVAPPSATALPVINVVDPVTSTTPSAPALAISPPITPFYDPMLDEMLKRPQTQNSIADTVSRASYIPGPTPGRAPTPISTSSPPVCHQNVEASIPSLQSAHSDTEGSPQIEVHQQGPFRRSSSDDLVGLDERTEEDGFIPVVRKRHPQATDTPHPSRRITRSQSHDTSSHSPSL
ncbi:uncharacterized protein PB18E9.04c-like [Olea europaea var. sylvestris]|uniref:uncharacterized protein PB18E9.04c-like n=1 Tax=Olea europaea var. sylvestris TaxID=158386 RepID=UPI000C1D2590|nr:uncharacterized protein PB18E9.04c-like [Olea europaea var. sylvestris]